MVEMRRCQIRQIVWWLQEISSRGLGSLRVTYPKLGWNQRNLGILFVDQNMGKGWWIGEWLVTGTVCEGSRESDDIAMSS